MSLNLFSNCLCFSVCVCMCSQEIVHAHRYFEPVRTKSDTATGPRYLICYSQRSCASRSSILTTRPQQKKLNSLRRKFRLVTEQITHSHPRSSDNVALLCLLFRCIRWWLVMVHVVGLTWWLTLDFGFNTFQVFREWMSKREDIRGWERNEGRNLNAEENPKTKKLQLLENKVHLLMKRISAPLYNESDHMSGTFPASSPNKEFYSSPASTSSAYCPREHLW